MFIVAYLEAGKPRYKSKWTKNSERPQSLHVKLWKVEKWKHCAGQANHHNTEVQDVPSIPEVGISVQHQSIGYNFKKALWCENDKEEMLEQLEGVP